MNSLYFLPSIPAPKSRMKIPATSIQSSPMVFAANQRRLTTASVRSSKPTKTIFAASTTIATADAPVPTISTNTVPAKKVLVPIGFGTEEMEAVILVDVLRRAGAKVTVASVEPQLEIEASGGTRLVADTSISKCSDEIFDLVALPGGMPGSVRLRDSRILQNIMSKQVEEERLYGAICAAPAITLLPWGLIKRKPTTCHPAFMDKLPTFWAVKSNIQVSGQLTTSRGPGTSFEFALSLVDQLLGEAVAKDIGQLLLMNGDEDNNPQKEEFNKVEWTVDRNPRVLIPVANGCEGIEIITIIDILRRAKVDVAVASVEKTVKVLTSQGTKIVADKLIGAAADSVYDLIILPGGIGGAERLEKSRFLKKLLKEQESGGRMYGAVCSSPAILHKQGLLKDKRSTGYSSVTGDLNGLVMNGPRVVIDGKLITGRGFSTVIDFALAIVSKFFGYKRARSVAEGLVFNYPRT